MKTVGIPKKAAEISEALSEPGFLLQKRLSAANELARRGKKEVEDFAISGGKAKIASKKSGGVGISSVKEALADADFAKKLGAKLSGLEPESYLLSLALFTSGNVIEAGEGEEAWVQLEESGKPAGYSMDFFLFNKNSSAMLLKSTAYASSHTSGAHIEVGREAKVQCCLLQKNSKAAQGSFGMHLSASEDSKTKFLRSNLGGNAQSDQLVFLQGTRGSVCEHYEASLANGSQKLLLESSHVHAAPDTYSRSVFNFGTAGNSRVDVDAKVAIEREAPRSDTHLLSRSLLMSEKSVSHVVPQLFVRNADVAAGHGSSMTPISEEELFYLSSRGIARNEGQRMVLMGFLQGLLAASGMDRRLAKAAGSEIEKCALGVFPGE